LENKRTRDLREISISLFYDLLREGYQKKETLGLKEISIKKLIYGEVLIIPFRMKFKAGSY